MIESMALQALSRWPSLASEAEVELDWFKATPEIERMGRAVLSCEHRMEGGEVPLLDCAVRACIPRPEEWLTAVYTASFATQEHGREWVRRLADTVALEALRTAALAAVELGGVSEAREALSAALRAGAVQVGIQDMATASRGLADRRAEALGRGETIGVPTGLPGLDRVLKGGWRPSSWVLLVGGSGAGKSTLETWFRRSLAQRGIYSLLFSGEMPIDDLAEREIHVALGLSLGRDLGFEQYSQVRIPDAASCMLVDPRQPIVIDRSSNAIQSEQEKKGSLGLVSLDSFGKIKPPRGPAGSVMDEVARYTWAAEQVKGVAMQRNVPILCLHHLNKGKSIYEEVKAGDMRGSQKVFDEADAVFGMWLGKAEGQVFLGPLKGRHRKVHGVIELRHHTFNQSYVEVPKQ